MQKGQTASDLRRFRTSDPATAHQLVVTTFANHDLNLDESKPVKFCLDTVASERLTLGRMSYGVSATLNGPPMQSCYHVNLLVEGSSIVEQKGVRRSLAARQAGVAFLPDAPVMVQWSADAKQYHIKLPTRVLETHAGTLLGRPDRQVVKFDLTFGVDASAGRALLASTKFLYRELARVGGIASMPLACRELESALMTQLLMTVPNQLRAALVGPAPRPGSARINEIIDFVDAHPDGAVTTADLAMRAGVTARALQLGFQHAVGMSPSDYVRTVRLDRVRRDLIAGRSPSVGDAAMRWGFYHLGRFAQQYRERFSELPSDTLRG
ncbi:AraC family transcriptional regulator [Rhodococcus erythropolis]